MSATLCDMRELMETPYIDRRVHVSTPAETIGAAIVEYVTFARTHPRDPLAPELLAVVRDLRDELRMREQEPWR